MAVKVRLSVNVEITADGNFGDDWQLKDIRKTGLLEAEHILRRLIKENKSLSMIGKPKAISFIHTEDLP